MVDVIYTTRPTDYASFIAADLGILNGCLSSDRRILEREKYEWAFKIQFIDNEFKKYNHQKHLSIISEIKPKYATVRDVMTLEQCKASGIEYYSLDQIIEWGYELKEYAQNVIIIPKYNCLDQIPKDFMLGYSVPSRYGGTPLPISLFKNWPVHLLGGSPKKQIELVNQYDNIVSFDNNYIELIAQKGNYVTPELKTKQLNKSLGFMINPRLVCLALSFNAIMARFKQQKRTKQKIWIPDNQMTLF